MTGSKFELSKLHPDDLDSLSEEQIKGEIEKMMTVAMRPSSEQKDQDAQDKILSDLQQKVVKMPPLLRRKKKV